MEFLPLNGAKAQANGNAGHQLRVVIVMDASTTTSLATGEDGCKGTERSAVYMIDELNRRGVYVNLIAPRGSMTPNPGKLWESRFQAIWREEHLTPEQQRAERRVSHETTVKLLNQILKEQQIDFIDCHIGHNAVINEALTTLGKTFSVPHMVTFHGPLGGDMVVKLARAYPDLPIATVSWRQLEPLQKQGIPLNHIDCLPNGLIDDVKARDVGREKGHLVMLGRRSPKKAFLRGIDIAISVGMDITIAGIVTDSTDEVYDKVIFWPAVKKAREDHPNIRIDVRTDVNESNKTDFLQGKTALLALTKRHTDDKGGPYGEADGMHITETLRAGTPVICDEGVDPSKVWPFGGFRCEYFPASEEKKANNIKLQVDQIVDMAEVLNDEQYKTNLKKIANELKEKADEIKPDENIKMLLRPRGPGDKNKPRITDVTYEDCRQQFLRNYFIKSTVNKRLAAWLKVAEHMHLDHVRIDRIAAVIDRTGHANIETAASGTAHVGNTTPATVGGSASGVTAESSNSQASTNDAVEKHEAPADTSDTLQQENVVADNDLAVDAAPGTSL